MKVKTKKMLRKRKVRSRKRDIKTNMKNKQLMIDKILSYSPSLLDGIEKYIDANKNFWLLIVIGIILRDFLLIALPCCLLAMFFSVRMFQLRKYKSVYTIVKELAEDLSVKGIYDQNKVDVMLNKFSKKYGQNISEYEALTNMFNNYKIFVLKIESLLKSVSINTKEKEDFVEENVLPDNNDSNIVISSNQPNHNLRIVSKTNNKAWEQTNVDNLENEFEGELSVLYRKKDGEIKKINRAIEFFEDESEKSHEKKNAVILKSNGMKNDKLTVYLYKKNVGLQNNAL